MKRILYLRHLETVLILKAKQDIQPFQIRHAIPINSAEQVPILLEIRKDSTKILKYFILNLFCILLQCGIDSSKINRELYNFVKKDSIHHSDYRCGLFYS
jgi:hypothetical protein